MSGLQNKLQLGPVGEAQDRAPSLWERFSSSLPELLQQLCSNDPQLALLLVKHPEQRAQLALQLSSVWKKRSAAKPLSSVETTWLLNEIFGLGPLQALIESDQYSEIMANGADNVFVERQGKLERSGVHFQNETELMLMIEKIAHFVGRQIDHRYPMLDARLPDGSRVNAVIAPLSLRGSNLTIRRFRKQPFTLQHFVELGMFSTSQKNFLELCVQARLNIIISGGTGSGKTSLLNALSFCIAEGERIVTIEDAAELQISQEHVISLETRPASLSGDPPVSIRDLVINALRMRPDRIIVGEVRGAEALDMLQAMNTGHDGSLTTGHANSPRDMLARIETMVMFAGYELPVQAIRKQISNAIDMIVHVSRHRDGRRVIESIVELVGMEGETLTTAELFRWQGDHLHASGLRPSFSRQFEEQGLSLPPDLWS